MSSESILNAVQDQYGVLNFDANDYAASVRVHALKPQAAIKSSRNQETVMKTIQVYDKPMCCSTGICGPSVDPVLPRFAADLDWLKSQGHQVERFNLAQQPQAFIQNAEVHQLLATLGTNCLPLIVVDGQVVSRRDYPSREMLSQWAGTNSSTSASSCCGGPAKQAGSACCAADEQSKITTGTGCGCAESACC